jgi:RNA polymerase sigma-70 factor (ECF subfamily)
VSYVLQKREFFHKNPVITMPVRRLSRAMTDEELTLLTDGDGAAWTRLYAETHRLLATMARRRLEPADAADAVAETYARAFAAIARYRPDRPPVAWLVGILRNVLRETARRTTAGGTPARAGTHEDDEPLATILRFEEINEVRQAVAMLDDADRRIVSWRVVEGRTSVEVARLTGQTPAAVRMAQTRAVRRLQRFAQVQGLEAGETA